MQKKTEEASQSRHQHPLHMAFTLLYLPHPPLGQGMSCLRGGWPEREEEPAPV